MVLGSISTQDNELFHFGNLIIKQGDLCRQRSVWTLGSLSVLTLDASRCKKKFSSHSLFFLWPFFKSTNQSRSDEYKKVFQWFFHLCFQNNYYIYNDNDNGLLKGINYVPFLAPVKKQSTTLSLPLNILKIGQIIEKWSILRLLLTSTYEVQCEIYIYIMFWCLK